MRGFGVYEKAYYGPYATPEILQEVALKGHWKYLHPLCQYRRIHGNYVTGIVHGLLNLGDLLLNDPVREVVCAEIQHPDSGIEWIYVFHGNPDQVLEKLKAIPNT